jgi:uncharacterized protein (DUF433 family)
MTLADLTPELLRLSPAEKVQAVQLLTSSLVGEWPGIMKTSGVIGGDACIRQTRIAVWMLEGLRRLGMTDQRILANYPGLTQSDLGNAWAYVAVNTAEIDDAIRRNDEA